MRRVNPKTIKNFENCSRIEVARVFQTDPSNINKWVKKGLKRKNNGTYNLTELIRFRLEEIGLKADAGQMDEELKKWTKTYRKEKALKARIERQEDENKLWSKDAVSKAWAARVVLIVSGFESLADRLSVSCEMKSSDEIFDLIKAEVKFMRKNYCQTVKFTQSEAVIRILMPCLQKLEAKKLWRPEYGRLLTEKGD